MDWQIDRAIELGIITQEQATEEMQDKLEELEADILDNNSFENEARMGTLPEFTLKSEADSRLIEEQKDHTRSEVCYTKQIEDLEYENKHLRRTNRDLREELNK